MEELNKEETKDCSLFGVLKEQIDNGRSGKNGIIPFQYEKLDKYLDISKNTMFTIAGESGSGKSSYTHEAFILKPLEWYFKYKDKKNIKLSIIYFGMERKMYMYAAKWISRMIFIETGKLLSVKKILGRDEFNQMTDEEYKLICKYQKVLDEWEKDETFTWFEGSVNPTGISIFVEEFSKRHGTVISNGTGTFNKKVYIPTHPNHIVLIITDHLSILSSEKQGGEKKQRLDKFSETMRKARDYYGYSPIIVQQMNRSISDVQRIKSGALWPKLSDLADTSSTTHDSDVILALYDPYRHMSEGAGSDPMGYDLNKLRDDRGYKFYRSVHILKSSFDGDGIATALGFYPFTGQFRTLPKKQDITDKVYDTIKDGTFFRE